MTSLQLTGLPAVAVRYGRALERWGIARQLAAIETRERRARQLGVQQRLELREREWDPAGRLPRL